MSKCSRCGAALPPFIPTKSGQSVPPCSACGTPGPAQGTSGWIAAAVSGISSGLSPGPVVLPATPPLAVSVAEHLDYHASITFTLSAGAVPLGTVWRHRERIPQEGSILVREITAIVAGHAGDVNLVLDSSGVKLVDSDRDKVLFERSLGILTVLDARNRDAETEQRLMRLERMMNVLVEQDSAAGEALRRLGGAKITYESPTRLARPAFFDSGSVVGIDLTINDALSLLNDVVVRVSIIGISKRPVL